MEWFQEVVRFESRVCARSEDGTQLFVHWEKLNLDAPVY
jgi:hypothetical protein